MGKIVSLRALCYKILEHSSTDTLKQPSWTIRASLPWTIRIGNETTGDISKEELQTIETKDVCFC